MRNLDSNGDTIVPEASSSDTSKNSIHPNALLSSVLVQTLVLKGIGPKKHLPTTNSLMYDISVAIVHILHTVKQLLIIGKIKLKRVIFPTAKKLKDY